MPSLSPLLRALVTRLCAALARAACARTMRRDASVCRPRSETMTKGAGRSSRRAGDESDRLSPGRDMPGPHPDPAILFGGFTVLLLMSGEHVRTGS